MTVSSRTVLVSQLEPRIELVHHVQLVKMGQPRRFHLAPQPQTEFAKIAAVALPISSKRKNAVEAKTRNAHLARSAGMAISALRSAQQRRIPNAELAPSAALASMRCLRALRRKTVFVPLVQHVKPVLTKLCRAPELRTDAAKLVLLANVVNIKRELALLRRTQFANPARSVVRVSS